MNEELVDHLKGRGMDPSLYNISYDIENYCVTFPLYSGDRRWVGYQVYRPNISYKKTNDPHNARYFTYLPNGIDGVFGLECLNDDKYIFVVEGVFKASKLHKLGYNAIAVLSNNPKRLKSWFRILKATRTLIAIGDNDDAGQKLVNFVKKGFKSPIDLDEMDNYSIVSMIEEYKGLLAQSGEHRTVHAEVTGSKPVQVANLLGE